MMRLFLAGLLLSAFAAPAWAEDCSNVQYQAAMNACADQAFMKSDAALNAAYKQIMARLADDAATKRLLMTAQRAWLKFRDAECTFVASASSGGTIYPMILAQCRDEITKGRTKVLQSYLNCQEGDLSCPVPPNAR